MELLSKSIIDLKPIEMRGRDDLPKSEILSNGQATSKYIGGHCLEACFKWKDKYLFITEFQPIFQELLEVYLTDSDFNILDSADISNYMTEGLFENLSVVGDSKIQFEFIGDGVWSLELLTEPKFCLPYIGHIRGVSRPFSWSTYFKFGYQKQKVGSQ